MYLFFYICIKSFLRIMKNPVAYLLVFYLFLSSCSGVEKEEPYVIAFSQCMMDDVWRQAMMLEMNIEASNYDIHAGYSRHFIRKPRFFEHKPTGVYAE